MKIAAHATIAATESTTTMTMESRLDDLEIRSAHLEAEQEQLTLMLLAQQKTIEELRDQLNYLKSVVREVAPSAVASRADETPPPHY
ncbi:MAG: SlyX family protein [Gammaproteobacteria bacterium]|nr:SlyX family protein [Gammaproteobacteria bacterium]